MHSGALNIFKSHMLAEIETGRQLSGGIDQFELVIMDVYEASSFKLKCCVWFEGEDCTPKCSSIAARQDDPDLRAMSDIEQNLNFS